MNFEVPPNLEQQLKTYSSQRGQTEQQALEEILRQALAKKDSPKQIRRSWVGLAKSGICDLSERVDELLFAEDLRRKS